MQRPVSNAHARPCVRTAVGQEYACSLLVALLNSLSPMPQPLNKSMRCVAQAHEPRPRRLPQPTHDRHLNTATAMTSTSLARNMLLLYVRKINVEKEPLSTSVTPSGSPPATSGAGRMVSMPCLLPYTTSVRYLCVWRAWVVQSPVSAHLHAGCATPKACCCQARVMNAHRNERPSAKGPHVALTVRRANYMSLACYAVVLMYQGCEVVVI